MKTNVTLAIDADLVHKANVLAEAEGTSVTVLLARRLEEALQRLSDYEEARRSALAQLEKGYELHWTPPKSRDELYER